MPSLLRKIILKYFLQHLNIFARRKCKCSGSRDRYSAGSIGTLLGCARMGPERPRPWTWKETQRRIRKASTSTSTRKGNSRRSTPSVSSTSRLGTMDNEKAYHYFFSASVFTRNSSTHRPREYGLESGQWTSAVAPAVREDQVCDCLKNLNICKSNGSWWDASQIPKGIGWHSPKTIFNVIWILLSVRWSPCDWKKGNVIPIFKKSIKRVTNLSASHLCWRRTLGRSPWKLC